MRTTSNSLESLLENHRHSDNRKTGERQSDLQSQCKMFSSFSELLWGHVHIPPTIQGLSLATATATA